MGKQLEGGDCSVTFFIAFSNILPLILNSNYYTQMLVMSFFKVFFNSLRDIQIAGKLLRASNYHSY